MKILCWMYNHNKWWSFYWRRPFDNLFYNIHERFCPDMKPEAV